MAASTSNGIFLRYRPLDEKSFEFLKMDDDSSDWPFVVVVAAVGVGAGAAFRWKLNANWECIVRSDQFDQPIANAAEPSPTDPKGMDMVKCAVPQVSAITTLTNKTINTNDHGGSQAAKKESIGVLDSIGAVVDYASSAASGYAMGGPAGALAGLAGTAIKRNSSQATQTKINAVGRVLQARNYKNSTIASRAKRSKIPRLMN